MDISADAYVMLMLCSRLGLSSQSEFLPLTLRDWNPLAKKLYAASIRPSHLLELDAVALVERLQLSQEFGEKIAQLLQRGGTIAIELERLASLGIHVLTRADEDYPKHLRERLKETAPAILFYSGEKALLGQPGIAVVGSRHVDDAGEACADFIGNSCGLAGLVLYSGGAKGVDSIGMQAALQSRGYGVGILADSLEKAIRNPMYREALKQGDLCLATPSSPNAPFSVGAAMGRNKLIYALATYAVVVASDSEKGGTWAGATEALKAQWIPIFVLEHSEMSDGNKMLIQKGGLAFPYPFPLPPSSLRDWLEEQKNHPTYEGSQPQLF